jgi:hypothetical protein
MDLHLRIVSIAASVVLLVIVLELVRRRRLFERYALLWVACAVALLLVAVWEPLLTVISNALGISYPPSALFVIGFGLIVVVLLHFSVAVSRLSDQSKTLAQRVAMLEDRLRQLEKPAASQRDGAASKHGDDSRHTGAAATRGNGVTSGTPGAVEPDTRRVPERVV